MQTVMELESKILAGEKVDPLALDEAERHQKAAARHSELVREREETERLARDAEEAEQRHAQTASRFEKLVADPTLKNLAEKINAMGADYQAGVERHNAELKAICDEVADIRRFAPHVVSTVAFDDTGYTTMGDLTSNRIPDWRDVFVGDCKQAAGLPRIG